MENKVVKHYKSLLDADILQVTMAQELLEEGQDKIRMNHIQMGGSYYQIIQSFLGVTVTIVKRIGCLTMMLLHYMKNILAVTRRLY